MYESYSYSKPSSHMFTDWRSAHGSKRTRNLLVDVVNVSPPSMRKPWSASRPPKSRVYTHNGGTVCRERHNAYSNSQRSK